MSTPHKLQFSKLLTSAWNHNKNTKGAILLVLIVMIIISVVINNVITRIVGVNPITVPFYVKYLIFPIITQLFIAPFYAGAIMVAIKRARGETITNGNGFQYFKQWIPIAITLIVVSFIVSIPENVMNMPGFIQQPNPYLWVYTIITGLAGIVLYLFLVLSVPLTADKHYNVFKAIGTSLERTVPQWLTMIAIGIFSYACLIASSIPLILGLSFRNETSTIIGSAVTIIALLWILPFLINLQGAIYYTLVDNNTQAGDASQ